MRKRKTHFEQVPLAMVMKIARQELLRARTSLAHCAICGHPVELERCKTDEDGDAVHEDCYVAKLLQPAQAKAGRRASTV